MIRKSEIRAYVRKLARQFDPERVILFGSYAHGKPTEDSDVDLMVIQNYRGSAADAAVEMRVRIPRRFPLDLILRKPSEVRRRLAMRDSFMATVLTEGQILYERVPPRVD